MKYLLLVASFFVSSAVLAEDLSKLNFLLSGYPSLSFDEQGSVKFNTNQWKTTSSETQTAFQITGGNHPRSLQIDRGQDGRLKQIFGSNEDKALNYIVRWAAEMDGTDILAMTQCHGSLGSYSYCATATELVCAQFKSQLDKSSRDDLTSCAKTLRLLELDGADKAVSDSHFQRLSRESKVLQAATPPSEGLKSLHAAMDVFEMCDKIKFSPHKMGGVNPPDAQKIK